jgi:dolichol-phosphate mannosyltransferase
MTSLSILIPVYNESATLNANMEKLRSHLNQCGLEARLILVDDGSSDSSWTEMCHICQTDPDCVAVRLSRNFGKECALFAGIHMVDTDLCLVMDSDLQHPPAVIPALLSEMEQGGADIVEGIKEDRGKESGFKKLTAKLFYSIFNALSGFDMKTSSDFKLLNRKVIDTMQQYTETGLFFRGLVDWSGFTKRQVPFSVEPRIGDKSKFSLKKMIQLAFISMISYTSKPLYLTVLMGGVFMVGAVALAIQTLFNFFTGRAVSGFTTVILLNLIVGGVILLTLGILGAYIGRIYTEVKRRPQFIVSDVYKNIP